MCQFVHVTDLRDEAFEILEENQNEDGHSVSLIDADQCEQAWERGDAEFADFEFCGVLESEDDIVLELA